MIFIWTFFCVSTDYSSGVLCKKWAVKGKLAWGVHRVCLWSYISAKKILSFYNEGQNFKKLQLYILCAHIWTCEFVKDNFQFLNLRLYYIVVHMYKYFFACVKKVWCTQTWFCTGVKLFCSFTKSQMWKLKFPTHVCDTEVTAMNIEEWVQTLSHKIVPKF